MKKFLSLVAIAALSTSVQAGDIAAGKAKSGTCAACHGAAGIAAMDMYPNLAGQKKGYLIKQLKAFKDGRRKDPVMGSMAKPLSDDDIKNLAAYYASLK
ncbi:cytochrome c [Litoribacillus peritrichatus]|uniref:Cytochrome c n=1 Tax=Litoribacillus peritrichatus TaxID=718191 RepID=A0ABP7M0L1_9GAMM